MIQKVHDPPFQERAWRCSYVPMRPSGGPGRACTFPVWGVLKHPRAGLLITGAPNRGCVRAGATFPCCDRDPDFTLSFDRFLWSACLHSSLARDRPNRFPRTLVSPDAQEQRGCGRQAAAPEDPQPSTGAPTNGRCAKSETVACSPNLPASRRHFTTPTPS